MRAALTSSGMTLLQINSPLGSRPGDRGIANDPRRREEYRASIERALEIATLFGARALHCLSGVAVPDLPHDTQWSTLVENTAWAAGKSLRYVGRVRLLESGKAEARVELAEYEAAHPLAGLRGGDNLILFRTRRYDQRPLVIRGPGAGPEVTAGGVFGDLLRVAAYLGAPL